MATAVKKIDGSYRKSEGTVLPGFQHQVNPLGMADGFSAPGLGYMFGQQSNFGSDNLNLREYALTEGWLTDTVALNKQYAKVFQEQITVKALVEPIKRFRINLDASRKESVNLTEYFRNTVENRTSGI